MKSLLMTILTFISFSTLAASHSAAEVTPEQRKQMAEMHTKLATCLNSSKPLQECREEMMKNYPHMGKGMGKGMGTGTGMGKGMGMGMDENWGCPMMGGAPQPDTKTKTTK